MRRSFESQNDGFEGNEPFLAIQFEGRDLLVEESNKERWKSASQPKVMALRNMNFLEQVSQGMPLENLVEFVGSFDEGAFLVGLVM